MLRETLGSFYKTHTASRV